MYSILQENMTIPMESVFSLTDVVIEDEEMSKIAKCLREITKAFSNPKETIGQFSLQQFPLSKQFKDTSSCIDDNVAVSTLYRYLQQSCFSVFRKDQK